MVGLTMESNIVVDRFQDQKNQGCELGISIDVMYTIDPLPANGPPRYANAASTSTLRPSLDSQTLALAEPVALGPPNPSEPNPPVELYCAELEPMPDSASFER